MTGPVATGARFTRNCLNRLQLANNRQMLDLGDPEKSLQSTGERKDPIAGLSDEPGDAVRLRPDRARRPLPAIGTPSLSVQHGRSADWPLYDVSWPKGEWLF